MAEWSDILNMNYFCHLVTCKQLLFVCVENPFLLIRLFDVTPSVQDLRLFRALTLQ